MSVAGAKSTIVIVDVMALRRAEVVSFLRPWAEARHFTLASFTPEDAQEKLTADSDRAMVIFRIGGEHRLNDPSPHLKILHALAPDAPLVVISDTEEASVVVSALNAGARGFVPAATKPELALEGLSFILNGGSF